MKKSFIVAAGAVIMLSASFLTGCTLLTYSVPVTETGYETANPHWAPPYSHGAHYYYIPDIETYYDLTNNEFIYLSNGQWCYSHTLPMMYTDYDLDNCFAVVLNINVYRPWMHHQYYVSHYPRYYYRDYYDHCNIPYVRGYNENSRSAVYWKENERNRARSWDDKNIRENRQFKYSKDDREQQRMTTREESTRERDTAQPSSRGSRATVSNRQDGSKENVRQGGQSQRSDRQLETSREATRQGTISEKETHGDIRSGSSTRQESVRSQNTNYYGRTIGNSVKVTRQMQEKSNRSSSKGRR